MTLLPDDISNEELLAYVTLLGCEVFSWNARFEQKEVTEFWWQHVQERLIMPGFTSTEREACLDCLRYKGVINDGNLSRLAIRDNSRKDITEALQEIRILQKEEG